MQDLISAGKLSHLSQMCLFLAFQISMLLELESVIMSQNLVSWLIKRVASIGEGTPGKRFKAFRFVSPPAMISPKEVGCPGLSPRPPERVGSFFRSKLRRKLENEKI